MTGNPPGSLGNQRPEPSADLPTELRREMIARDVSETGYTRVADLSARYQVSEVTVRNDLDALDRQGILRRVRGGATGGNFRKEPTHEEALGINADEKLNIARHAADMVRPNETIFLDVGTTCVAIAHQLVEREDLVDVLIATNGLRTALALEPAIPRFTVVVSGGTLRPLQHSLVDPLATSAIGNLRVHTAFIGCNGITTDGIYNLNLPEAEIKRRMIEAARNVVVVADGSKVGEASIALISELNQIDSLITGASADIATVQKLEKSGVSVQIAK